MKQDLAGMTRTQCITGVFGTQSSVSPGIWLLPPVGFKLFDRLPRGVKLSAAGTLFLEDARHILDAVSEATARAARVARGQSGTLRVGFTENASWHGFWRFRELQPDAELQL